MKSTKQTIKIGTRNSPLAIWQAKKVAQNLESLGYSTQIIPVISSGDKNLTKPLYTFGITGIFTRDLDIALLTNKVDIAVHSLKDVPTKLPKGITIYAVLERDFPEDILIRKESSHRLPLEKLRIATSSLRRRAFWLNLFPETTFEDIRGNIQTRLKKLNEGNCDATILSLAGIKRMQIGIDYEIIDFILPAPAQGVIAICGCTENDELTKILLHINHRETEICTKIERNFLNYLESGCTAPIGAFAKRYDKKIVFNAQLSSPNGKKSITLSKEFIFDEKIDYGQKFAQEILDIGGKEIIKNIN